MKYCFCYETLKNLFPNFEWEVDALNIYGTDMTKPAEKRTIVKVHNIHVPVEDQSWRYTIYEVDKFDEDILMSEQIDGLEPKADLFGNFSYLGKMAYAYMNDEDVAEIPLVVAIVGESGSGKTALSLAMQERGIANLVSYTTRPMREGETDGVEHWFVTEDKMPDKEDMLAYTHFGNCHYWTDIRDLDIHKVMTYVIDERGLLDLYELKKQGRIDVMYIKIIREDNPTDEERKNRDACREEALQKMAHEGIKPNAIIYNDYGSVEEFLEKETGPICDYVNFINLDEMIKWENL